MSLSYLLDGYNIINRIPALAQKEFNESRLSLIRFLEVQQPQGSSNNQVILVFDGQPGIWNWNEPLSSLIKVVFSLGESADDYIKKYVGASAAKKSIVVVTDDKDIKFFVRAQGATVLSVVDFMGKAQAKEHNRRDSAVQKNTDTKHISKTLEYKINAELEAIWLKKTQDKNPDGKHRG